MRERVDPPPSPSRSSSTGVIAPEAIFLGDSRNQNHPISSISYRQITVEPSEESMINNPERLQDSFEKKSIRGTDASLESETISFHDALSESYEEFTVHHDCYEDLTISSSSRLDASSTQDEDSEERAIQQYRAQLSLRRKSDKEHPTPIERKDNLKQLERDMKAFDLFKDSDSTEEDPEMQTSRDIRCYQKLVGPIYNSQKINWKTSIFFLPCFLVFMIVTISTVVVMRRQNQGTSLLAESSAQPTATLAPSESPSITQPSQSPQSTTFPPTIDGTLAQPTSCSSVFPPFNESWEIIFLPPSFHFDVCTKSADQLSSIQRLNCFGTTVEYRPKAFIPNRFRDSN